MYFELLVHTSGTPFLLIQLCLLLALLFFQHPLILRLVCLSVPPQPEVPLLTQLDRTPAQVHLGRQLKLLLHRMGRAERCLLLITLP